MEDVGTICHGQVGSFLNLLLQVGFFIEGGFRQEKCIRHTVPVRDAGLTLCHALYLKPSTLLHPPAFNLHPL